RQSLCAVCPYRRLQPPRLPNPKTPSIVIVIHIPPSASLLSARSHIYTTSVLISKPSNLVQLSIEFLQAEPRLVVALAGSPPNDFFSLSRRITTGARILIALGCRAESFSHLLLDFLSRSSHQYSPPASLLLLGLVSSPVTNRLSPPSLALTTCCAIAIAITIAVVDVLAAAVAALRS
ncbi:hypothetical protein TARUN_9917, partial [Trichoderma arundinaceum]